jgi:methylated-DNA-[protein]-cysteine S-methyltransferase
MEVVHTAEFESPVGTLRCASTGAGLAHVELPRASGRGFTGWLLRFAPGARVEEAWAPNREAITQIVDYLEGKRRRFDLSLDLRGTAFQRRVYDALLRIPYGETRTYGEIAREIGAARAVRAVGSANGANPLPLVVPCHRVVASGGRLGGFGGGLRLKRWLLAHEHVRPLEGDLL